MSQRVDDWPNKLNRYIVANRDKPFVWGKSDCVIFVAGAVKEITGVDYMEEFRGKYDSEESAKEALRDLGAGSLYHTLRTKLGNPIPAAQGKRGDVAYDDGAVGLIIGRSAIFVGEGGYVLIPISQVKRAFHIE